VSGAWGGAVSPGGHVAMARPARNWDGVQAWVKAETGWNMEIISAWKRAADSPLGVTGMEEGAGAQVC